MSALRPDDESEQGMIGQVGHVLHVNDANLSLINPRRGNYM